MTDVKYCLQCSKQLTSTQKRGKFCSRSCSATYNNLKTFKRVAKIHECKFCHKTMTGRSIYCETCHSNGIINRRTLLLEHAKSDETRRKFLIRVRGDRCEDCRLSEWIGVKLVIQLHHIDGNPDNNLESNLKLLCPNCHSITPNYASRNRSKNDTSRNRKRRNHYKTGKFVENAS